MNITAVTYRESLQFSNRNVPVKKQTKDFNEYFRENIQMADKHIKRSLTALVNRGMKIKPSKTPPLLLLLHQQKN